MSYWDTSTLVKIYAQEADTFLFRKHLFSGSAIHHTSRISIYETKATFWRKEADKVITAGAAKSLQDEFFRDIAAGVIRLVEIESGIQNEYDRVLQSCYQQSPSIPIRTLDAIHLASAKVSGHAEIVTTDVRMREAARMLGYTVFPL